MCHGIRILIRRRASVTLFFEEVMVCVPHCDATYPRSRALGVFLSTADHVGGSLLRLATTNLDVRNH